MIGFPFQGISHFVDLHGGAFVTRGLQEGVGGGGAFGIFSYNEEFRIFYCLSQIPTILFEFKNN